MTQQRVLGLLFGQPDRSFYATELIGLVGAGSGAVQRELTARGLLAETSRSATHTFVVSDDEPHFRSVGARFLGERLSEVEVMPLG